MKPFIPALFLLALGSTALASDMQAGLWEIQHDSRVNGQALPKLSEMMANVPPEMRAQVQAAMAAQGIGLSDNAIRLCISAEEARNNAVPIEQDKDCQVQRKELGKGHWQMTLQCSSPPSQGEGEIRLRADGRSWQTNMTLNSQEKGQAQVMQVNSEGRWLSADCGPIKPR